MDAHFLFRPAWWRDELSAEERRWLFTLPGSLDLELSGRRVRMVHASPIDEFTRVQREHSAEPRSRRP